MHYSSNSVKDTQKIAADLARKILKLKKSKTGVVIALEGELGAGKTVFAKGFVKVFGIKKNITSPTFVLMKRYNIKKGSFKFIYHIDAYRLIDHKDLINLGVEDIIADSENIVLIEWSDRVSKILPKKYVKVHTDHIGENSRKITIS